MAAIAQQLPEKDRLRVFAEALTVLRKEHDFMRAMALASVAKRLPAEEQPAVLAEALSAARGCTEFGGVRARALREVAERLPVEEALVVARGINDAELRAEALAEVAERLGSGQISGCSVHRWVESVRVLAARQRGESIEDFAAILPLMPALGGEDAVRILVRSIVKVGAWWP